MTGVYTIEEDIANSSLPFTKKDKKMTEKNDRMKNLFFPETELLKYGITAAILQSFTPLTAGHIWRVRHVIQYL